MPCATPTGEDQSATSGRGIAGKTAEEMDEERQQNVAYEYLCHLEEAKNWMSACVGETLPATTDLEESLRNGVYLAKLAHFFAPDVVSRRKIFDEDFRKFYEGGLHFRHTDNISHFLKACRAVRLPETFLPETTDIYDRKNMPRAIFCIHALSLYLFRMGIGPQIQDLYGKVTFSQEEISNMRRALDLYGISMPQFRKIGGILASEMPVDEAELHAAIIAINDAIDHNEAPACLEALMNPAACLSAVQSENAQSYLIVLASQKKEKIKAAMERTLNDSYVADAYDELLSQGEIQGHLNKVNLMITLEKLSLAVREGRDGELLQILFSKSLNLKNTIKKDRIEAYMFELRRELDQTGQDFLSIKAIDGIVTSVNQRNQEKDARFRAICALNVALSGSDPRSTVQALAEPSLGLRSSLHAFAATLYHSELKFAMETAGADLGYEGIVSLVGFFNVIAEINLAVQRRDADSLWRHLCHRRANLEDLEVKHKSHYCEALLKALMLKEGNLDEHVRDLNLLTHSEIQEVIDNVNDTQVKSGIDKVDVEALAAFQARARGFLVRQKMFSMLQYYYDHENLVIRAQAVFRGILARRRFRQVVKAAISRVGQEVRQKRRELAAIRIQRCWRRHKHRSEFEMLTKSKIMSLPAVRKYLHMLNLQSEDFNQELLLQSLKADITKAIRLNKQLETDVDSMDIKIGLLVKNRISVQDVVAHSRSLARKASTTLRRKETFYHQGVGSGDSTGQNQQTMQTGLKALRKESRQKLDSYQHLFYLLQTEPSYLARLVFAMPQSKTNKFLESVVLTLYNFGANQREEYLLLKLFKTALEEEIRCKVDKLSDIITGQPMVIKIIVSFNRNGKGQKSLREMLGPLINRVLEDKSLQINTNPVEIYKQWVNQMEFDSGKSSGMPYTVTPEEALQHEEVTKRLSRSITRLKQVATLFLTTIVKSQSKIPYGMLYIARVLHDALTKKFPDMPEKEILKVVGNLIYYRYINGAIVAPDSCDIVDVNSVEQALNAEQRKNLGSIAKLLQFAASKKGFGEESAHLSCLNNYIIDAHERFRNFFYECCQVEDLEEHFAVDQFSEATLIAKPVIYITLSEICDTHQLLLNHRFQVAPDENDRVHEVLDALGGKPSLCSLLGAAEACPPHQRDASLATMGQTEVCLTLTNKFEATDDHTDMDKLFVKTKQLLASVLPCTGESNLLGCLKSVPSLEQLRFYARLVNEREERDKMAENNKTMLDHTNMLADDDNVLSLEECKRQILRNLQILERHDYVSKKDGFQAIISSLGKDIVNQRQHRVRRAREIERLEATRLCLENKKKFYEDQISYYQQYLRQCLANLQAEGGGTLGRHRRHKLKGDISTGSSSQLQKLKSKQAVKYSGAKLHHKGILLTIEGLPENQFKNVQFEFVPAEEDGIFEVHARFMGVKLEHVEVDIQELLNLQYEGVSVMNMFGKARINVNLLLHLLNVKFYGRK